MDLGYSYKAVSLPGGTVKEVVHMLRLLRVWRSDRVALVLERIILADAVVQLTFK